MRSRNISLSEYRERLEIEYFQMMLRMQINHSPKQKKFFARVMAQKKEKILEITEKMVDKENIFCNAMEYQELKKLVFPTSPAQAPEFFPNLTDKERGLLFAPGTKVKVETQKGVLQTATICANNGAFCAVKMRGAKNEITCPIVRMVRIF